MHPSADDTYHLFYHPTSKQQEQAMYTTDLAIYAAPIVIKGYKALTRPAEPVPEGLDLSKRPTDLGYDIQEWLSENKYADFEQTPRGAKGVDFKTLLEKTEAKSLNISRKSYNIDVQNGQVIRKGKLSSTLSKYRDQLLNYDTDNPTPFNVMEIQLISADKLQFHQDMVFRDFVESSARLGVRVEVYDVNTQKLLIGSRSRVIPTEPRR